SGAFNRVAVLKPISIRSLNGPEFTALDGAGAVRCAYLANGARLTGFTLTNGFTAYSFNPADGGGVLCADTNGVVSNCVLVGNSARYGGGSYRGNLINCTLANNTARSGGGACSDARLILSQGRFVSVPNALLTHCALAGNRATDFAVGGGGAYGKSGGCVLQDCLLTNNSGSFGDWPGAAATSCTLNRCTVAGNGGDSAVRNCTLNS